MFIFGSEQVTCFAQIHAAVCAAVLWFLNLKENSIFAVLQDSPHPRSSSLATPSLSTKQTDWQVYGFPAAVQTFLQPLGKLQTLQHFNVQLLRSSCLL